MAENTSLLKGTTWYWRQGVRETPMHSHRDWGDVCKTKELYMPVRNENQAGAIIDELRQNGIQMSMKRTHSSFDVVPAGSLIVFAASSLSSDIPEEKANVIKLKKYILAHEGTIIENRQKKSVIKSFILSLFGGGRK